MKLNIRFYSQLLLVTALFFSSLSIGQENPVKPKSDFWEKVRFGGGVGINFRNNSTNIAVAPSALYQPNEYIAFGPGLNYTYQKFNDLSTSLFGGSAIFIAKPIDLLHLPDLDCTFHKVCPKITKQLFFIFRNIYFF